MNRIPTSPSRQVNNAKKPVNHAVYYALSQQKISVIEHVNQFEDILSGATQSTIKQLDLFLRDSRKYSKLFASQINMAERMGYVSRRTSHRAINFLVNNNLIYKKRRRIAGSSRELTCIYTIDPILLTPYAQKRLGWLLPSLSKILSLLVLLSVHQNTHSEGNVTAINNLIKGNFSKSVVSWQNGSVFERNLKREYRVGVEQVNINTAEQEKGEIMSKIIPDHVVKVCTVEKINEYGMLFLVAFSRKTFETAYNWYKLNDIQHDRFSLLYKLCVKAAALEKEEPSYGYARKLLEMARYEVGMKLQVDEESQPRYEDFSLSEGNKIRLDEEITKENDDKYKEKEAMWARMFPVSLEVIINETR